MGKISVIIPVYNEAHNLPKLLDSLLVSDFSWENYEILVIDDGSTDDIHSLSLRYPKVRFVHHPKNLGRFAARKTGAMVAKFSRLLFIDARCIAPPDLLQNFSLLSHPVICGKIIQPKKLTWFEVFYFAIRKKLFKKYYSNQKGEIMLTVKFFDQYPKGTGLFGVKRDLFLLCLTDVDEECFDKDSSDDTRMLRHLTERYSLLVTPKISVINYGRTDFFESIKHLFLRGAKFVDYYLKYNHKRFLQVVFPPLVFVILFSILLVSAISHDKTDWFFAGVFIVWTLVVMWLRPTWKELPIVFVMLPIVSATFYSGVLRGIMLYLSKSRS